MSATLDLVRTLVAADDYIVSQHGGRRLSARSIQLDDVVAGLAPATVVEDYPLYFTGPAVLVLYFDPAGAPMHALWGVEAGTSRPAMLITAYRPDAAQWSPDFRTRKP